MTEKRFRCVFKEHETKNSWSMIKDNQLDKPLYIKDVVDLLNELSEEKEYFERKKEYFLSKWSIVNAKNIQLRQEIDDLKEENEQLRKQLQMIS